jgi:hypothetical protein
MMASARGRKDQGPRQVLAASRFMRCRCLGEVRQVGLRMAGWNSTLQSPHDRNEPGRQWWPPSPLFVGGDVGAVVLAHDIRTEIDPHMLQPPNHIHAMVTVNHDAGANVGYHNCIASPHHTKRFVSGRGVLILISVPLETHKSYIAPR